jgi:ribosomal protein S18 acetylase RimI-like enzyme
LTTQNVIIARATWRDVVSLWRLERVCFPGDAYDPLTLLTLVAGPSKAALKAMAGNGLVGFIAGDEPWGDHFAWIVTLGVAPQFRQRGIGARLLGECEARLSRPVLRLMVRESNAPAIALYKRFGYSHIRREMRYYNGGEAGLMMEKRRA